MRTVLRYLFSTLLCATPGWAQWDAGVLLLASDGSSGDQFSQSVAVSGNVAIAGAWKDDDNGTDSGAAYILRFSGGSWTEEQKLVPADGSTFDTFGVSADIFEDVAVVGCHLDDDNGTDSGSVYVYRFDGSNWIQEQKLLASDGSAAAKFGYSVGIDGNAIVVGAYGVSSSRGAAYVFRHNGSSWAEEAKLLASDGQIGDWLGVSSSISGSLAVIGAARDDDKGSDAGSAYIFSFNGSGWNQESKLLAADGAAGDMFGISASISGDVALIGAWQDDDNGGQSGSAYVFAANGSSWSMEQKLTPSNGENGDRFGFAVSIDDGRILAGAHLSDGELSDMGSAYVFDRLGSAWSETIELHDPSGFLWDNFGYAVSVSGDGAAVGIVNDDVAGTNSGSLVFFAFTPPDACLGDLDGSGDVGTPDTLILLGEWGENPGSPADLDDNGVVDTEDYLILLANWGPC